MQLSLQEQKQLYNNEKKKIEHSALMEAPPIMSGVLKVSF